MAGRPQPGGREPAPGALALVQDFVNTVDLEHGPDLLDDAAGLREWLDLRDLAPGAVVSAADLRHAREVREALRALLLANNGGPEAPDAPLVLEKAAERAGLVLRLPGGSAALVPVSRGVDGALGAAVAAVPAAIWDGTWRRMKACRMESCHWAFYDRSSNNSAAWCSMAVCGGRAKASAYYRRRRASDA